MIRKTHLALVTTAFLVATFAAAEDIQPQPVSNKTKSSVTRTSLHIARSLDPSQTELLSVRGRNGEMATLIVKKREGRRNFPAPQVQPLERAGKASEAVPKPVEIRSDMVFIKDASSSKKKGRTLTVDSDGVPVIEGVREPDTEEDKRQTWRNARVVDGVLIPYKQALTPLIPTKHSHNEAPTEKKEVSVSSYFQSSNQPSSMFSEGDAVRTQWKGIAESMPLPLTQREPAPAKLIEYILKANEKELNGRKKQGRSMEMEERMDENVDENDEPIWVNTQTKEIWTENGKIKMADRRSDTEMEETEEKESFVPISPEARLLQPQGVSNHPPSLLYSRSRVSFEEGVRTPVLQYAHPELGVQPARVASSSAENSSQEPPLSYFSEDPYADRSPYAYEPGMSHGEDTLTASSQFQAPDVANSLGEGRRHSSVNHIEFTTSSPGLVNPDEIDITEPPRKYEGYGLAGDKYIKRYPYSGYYGAQAQPGYPMSKEDYYKYKMSGMSYGNNYYQGGYKMKIPDNRPFWEKLTDSIKETVQSGVESMKDLTRPVMEPIVEATQRISHNLGINEATAKIGSTFGFNQGTGMRTAFQEKMGDVAASPVLLPALGLVAGGAALGLGAVAVGKMLDVNPVNLLKRSEDGDVDGLEMEHKRALEGTTALPDTMVLVPLINRVNSGDRTSRQHDATHDLVVAKGDNVLQKSEGESVVLVRVKQPKHLPVGNEPESESKQDFKRLIDESGIEGLERFHFNVNEELDKEHLSRRRSLADYSASRRRRSVFNIQRENEEYLDNLLTSQQLDQEALLSKMATLGHPDAWSNTPCAKKMFCDVVSKQSRDAAMLMEKKIATFLALIKPPVADTVAYHLHDVMMAVHQQDCSKFECQRYSR